MYRTGPEITPLWLEQQLRALLSETLRSHCLDPDIPPQALSMTLALARRQLLELPPPLKSLALWSRQALTRLYDRLGRLQQAAADETVSRPVMEHLCGRLQTLLHQAGRLQRDAELSSAVAPGARETLWALEAKHHPPGCIRGLEARLWAIFHRQDLDGDQRFRYSRAAGKEVFAATSLARALFAKPPENSAGPWLRRQIAALVELANGYHHHPDNREGLGGGTLGEILRDMLQLAEEIEADLQPPCVAVVPDESVNPLAAHYRL